LISRCAISPPSGVSRIFGNSSSGKPARPGAIDPPTRRVAWNIYIGRAEKLDGKGANIKIATIPIAGTRGKSSTRKSGGPKGGPAFAPPAG
jgi:hypothetical protein